MSGLSSATSHPLMLSPRCRVEHEHVAGGNITAPSHFGRSEVSRIFNISQISAITRRYQNNRAAEIELLSRNQDSKSPYIKHWTWNNVYI